MLLLLFLAVIVPFSSLFASLAPCPDSPNCVSSLAEKSSSHYVAPILYTGDEDPLVALLEIVQGMSRSRLERREGNYLHVTFRSLFFGFVDDVEFEYDPDHGVINVRSASRSGYYDFGVNRRRVKKIRKRFKKFKISTL